MGQTFLNFYLVQKSQAKNYIGILIIIVGLDSLLYINELEFEGEYLNGKRWNGRVKEYYNNNTLKFEGEYFNGKRNGKGKEYNDNGTLKFEGEYLNGERI